LLLLSLPAVPYASPKHLTITPALYPTLSTCFNPIALCQLLQLLLLLLPVQVACIAAVALNPQITPAAIAAARPVCPVCLEAHIVC
jgi:hypothetical protein